MLKKIMVYFKNTDSLQIQLDFYALLFISAGIFSAAYLTGMIAGWIKK